MPMPNYAAAVTELSDNPGKLLLGKISAIEMLQPEEGFPTIITLKQLKCLPNITQTPR